MKKIWNAIKNFFSKQSTEDKVEAFIVAAETISKFTSTEFDDIGAAKLRADKKAMVIFLNSI